MPYKSGQRGTMEERFWKKVKRLDNGCWQWTAWLYEGYGRISYPITVPHAKAKIAIAHVWCYKKYFRPVEKGKELHHRCQNKGCVNPFHLIQVTKRDHVFLGNNACALNKRKTHCKHGHIFAGDNLDLYLTGSRRCRTCGKQNARRQKFFQLIKQLNNKIKKEKAI